MRDAERRRADAGWQTEISETSDGRWDWLTKNEDVTIAMGTADTWDDAKLESILDSPPPSGER